jgi:hypothetical protein
VADAHADAEIVGESVGEGVPICVVGAGESERDAEADGHDEAECEDEGVVENEPAGVSESVPVALIDGESVGEVVALVVLLSVPINDGTVATTLALCDGVVHADALRDGDRDADSEGVALEHDDAVGESEFVAVALALSDGEPDVDLNIEADA